MNDSELLSTLDRMRTTMISVATGGERIGMVNHQFQENFRDVADALSARGIDNTLPYDDLWQWYGKWSADLVGYASRRAYVADVFSPLIARVRNARVSEAEPTGWARVDRAMQDSRERLPRAKNEEQFQAIGLLCREALITLAQEVFDPEKHLTEPGIRVSSTDFKRMIEAYIAVEMSGGAAEELRRHARTAVDLALRLQHQRTAGFRDAAICIEATSAIVNMIAIVSGRRDPQLRYALRIERDLVQQFAVVRGWGRGGQWRSTAYPSAEEAMHAMTKQAQAKTRRGYQVAP